MAPMMVTTIPIKTVSEANQREHWAKKAARQKKQRHAAWLMTKSCPLPCIVTLTRIGPRTLDDDNLRGAMKATRDGVADRLGIDDADPRVEWRYGQRRGLPKQYAVEIEIAAGDELDAQRGRV